MLNGLPKHSKSVFGANSDAMRKSFQRQRKRMAAKLKNSRLLQISFHTFRHWKATMEYHKTRDILHVMQMLGHRNIQNTLISVSLMMLRSKLYFLLSSAISYLFQRLCSLRSRSFSSPKALLRYVLF
mgnify:CR=1 FL=1